MFLVVVVVTYKHLRKFTNFKIRKQICTVTFQGAIKQQIESECRQVILIIQVLSST